MSRRPPILDRTHANVCFEVSVILVFEGLNVGSLHFGFCTKFMLKLLWPLMGEATFIEFLV